MILIRYIVNYEDMNCSYYQYPVSQTLTSTSKTTSSARNNANHR